MISRAHCVTALFHQCGLQLACYFSGIGHAAGIQPAPHARSMWDRQSIQVPFVHKNCRRRITAPFVGFGQLLLIPLLEGPTGSEQRKCRLQVGSQHRGVRTIPQAQEFNPGLNIAGGGVSSALSRLSIAACEQSDDCKNHTHCAPIELFHDAWYGLAHRGQNTDVSHGTLVTNVLRRTGRRHCGKASRPMTPRGWTRNFSLSHRLWVSRRSVHIVSPTSLRGRWCLGEKFCNLSAFAEFLGDLK